MARDETYELFRQAIRHKLQLVCVYNGLEREVCPHVLGTGRDGQHKALTYQFAGRSTKELPRGGAWKCLNLSRVRNPQLRQGPWHSSLNFVNQQTCVQVIDEKVDEEAG